MRQAHWKNLNYIGEINMNKFTYYKVIQTNSGYGWDDDDFHVADSSGHLKDYKSFKENYKAYQDNFMGPIRVIFRKELIKVIL